MGAHGARLLHGNETVRRPATTNVAREAEIASAANAGQPQRIRTDDGAGSRFSAGQNNVATHVCMRSSSHNADILLYIRIASPLLNIFYRFINKEIHALSRPSPDSRLIATFSELIYCFIMFFINFIFFSRQRFRFKFPAAPQHRMAVAKNAS
jgi:hypothetical protein